MRKNATRTIGIILIVFTIISVQNIFAQQVNLPRTSPQTVTTQTVGISDITVVYHRPGVKERKIWGSLVPNDQVWRAGANENTTITFSHDAMVEGQKIAAGTYGLHMIPKENEWTIIFSEMHTAWGSFSYKEEEDVLRVSAKPREAEYKERLAYEFVEKDGDTGISVALHWEKMRVPFKVEFDTPNIVLSRARADLRGSTGFGWQGWFQIANYCLQNNFNHEEAIGWADKAVSRNKNFNTMRVKSGLLAQTGKEEDAYKLMDEAVEIADQEWMLNWYGYQLIGQDKIEDAIKIFELNVKRYPDSWNPYDSLAEAHAKAGDKKKAKKYYKMALDKLPETDGNNKTRINGILAEL